MTILVQTISISPPIALPQIFWKALHTSTHLYSTFRAHAAYGIAFAKILTDHKDILSAMIG